VDTRASVRSKKVVSTPQIQERRRQRASSPLRSNHRENTAKRQRIATPPPAGNDSTIYGDEDVFDAMDDIQMNDVQPSSPVTKAVERKTKAIVKAEAPADDDDEDMMEVAHAGGITATSVNMSGVRPQLKVIKTEPYPSPESSSPTRAAQAIDASSWNNVTQNLAVASSSQFHEHMGLGQMDSKDIIEEDSEYVLTWENGGDVKMSVRIKGQHG
jgi:DNA polymerase alpha subunit A